MGSKYGFFFLPFTNNRDPQIILKNNLGDDQKTGISGGMRSAFLKKRNWDVRPLNWKSRLIIFYFHKHRYSIFYICLLIAFWRFLNFLSEPRLKRRLATPRGAIRKLRLNSSPASSWGWYITRETFTTEKQRAYCPNIYTVSSPGFTNNQVDINLRLSFWRWTFLLPFVCFCVFTAAAPHCCY